MYSIGKIFKDNAEYDNIAKYCNDHNLRIVEIEPDTEGRRFQIQALPKLTREEILMELRLRRENECFSIVNRGQVWYENLSVVEKEELKIWYKKWLDITLTYIEGIDIEYIIPKKPTWLK